MSVESKRLRNQAASQLRAGRRTKNQAQKGIHEDRAATFKAQALTEEWLAGERQRSRITTHLSMKQCMEEARRCRALARNLMTEPHRVMLNHIASTWERIAGDIADSPARTKKLVSQ